MPEVLAILVVLLAVAGALWLAYTTQAQVRQLRRELDTTQQQLNELRREVSELKAATEVLPPPPPPLPKSRSGGLQDLREQLRAAHREEEPTDES